MTGARQRPTMRAPAQHHPNEAVRAQSNRHRGPPLVGGPTVTSEAASGPRAGSVLVDNHTSLADPAVVIAALRRYRIEPVVMAAPGPWRLPLLGAALRREGHVPVRRGTARAGESLDTAGAVTAPLRRPDLHGHIGAPLHLPGPLPEATLHIQAGVSTAWQSAIRAQRR